jgi:hypothetical protein
MRGRHSILADVALAYGHSRDRYVRAMGRGDTDRADDAMSEMQQIENSITVVETNTAWRAMLSRCGGR